MAPTRSLLRIFFSAAFLICFSLAANETTTSSPPGTVLRQVQIVFRHGDRAPLLPIFPRDPFNSTADWPHGFDQLTTNGRARMFRLGQMIRAKYADYLGDDFSPRDVYVRSSAIDRCLESAQLVLAGSYPPNSAFWQWDINGAPLPLGKLWQPIPVASFLPPNDDSLLRTKKPCPKADSERQGILSSSAMQSLLIQHKSLLEEVSRVSGYKVDEIIEADRFHENMAIEHESGFFWSDRLNGTAGFNWTKEREIEVLRQLETFSYARWNNEWNSTLIKRVRAGELLNTIADNFHQKKSILDLENENKLVLFSSHDTKVAALLFALDIWNGILVPYSTSIIFELHQSTLNVTDFFVAVKYYNETMALLDSNSTRAADFKDAYSMTLPQCAPETVTIGGTPLCPLERFIAIVQQFKFTDWNAECGIDTQYSDGGYLSGINILMLIANLTVFFVLLLLVMYFITKIRSRPGYERLE